MLEQTGRLTLLFTLACSDTVLPPKMWSGIPAAPALPYIAHNG